MVIEGNIRDFDREWSSGDAEGALAHVMVGSNPLPRLESRAGAPLTAQDPQPPELLSVLGCFDATGGNGGS